MVLRRGLPCSAVSHESVRLAISGAANKDVTQRKLFVRGLSWETTTEDLLAVSAAACLCLLCPTHWPFP